METTWLLYKYCIDCSLSIQRSHGTKENLVKTLHIDLSYMKQPFKVTLVKHLLNVSIKFCEILLLTLLLLGVDSSCKNVAAIFYPVNIFQFAD